MAAIFPRGQGHAAAQGAGQLRPGKVQGSDPADFRQALRGGRQRVRLQNGQDAVQHVGEIRLGLLAGFHGFPDPARALRRRQRRPGAGGPEYARHGGDNPMATMDSIVSNALSGVGGAEA